MVSLATVHPVSLDLLHSASVSQQTEGNVLEKKVFNNGSRAEKGIQFHKQQLLLLTFMNAGSLIWFNFN